MGSPFSALTLNGSTQYATTPSHAQLNMGTDSFTVEFWAKTAAAGPLVNKYDNGASTGWLIEVLAGATGRATLNATNVSGGSGLLDSAWHHYALVVDRSSGKARFFVDGVSGTAVDITSVTTLSSSAVLQIGRNPAASTFFNGTISELRISNTVRYTEDFTTEVSQFEDDGATVLLYHFNEGTSGKLFDMSAGTNSVFDPGVRHTATLFASPAYAYGPLFASPVKIIHEGIWHALDTDAELTKWGNYRRLQRHRARRTDPNTGRLLGSGLIAADTPGLFVSPESIASVPPVTSAYYDVNVPFLIEGAIYNPGTFDLSTFHWMFFRALAKALFETSGGHLYTRQLQKWDHGPVQLFNIPDAGDTGNLFARFAQEIRFVVRADLHVTTSP